MMRVVLDTNVFISAILGGTMERVVDHWRAGDFLLVVTNEVVQEYLEVLRRPKFGLTGSIIDAAMAYVLQKAEFVLVDERLEIIDADPSDNKFLEAAIAGKAEWIVSGDQHLLNLQTCEGIAIITARQFLDYLSE